MSVAPVCFVEITDEPVSPGRNWTDPKTGMIKPLPSTQRAYLWTGGTYPEANFDVEVPDSGPYRPGFYLLAGSSLRVSMRKETKGDIQFNKYGVELVCIADALKQLDDDPLRVATGKPPASVSAGASKPDNKIAAVG